MIIINLTQHDSTPAQKAAGVVEPSDKQVVKALLTFNAIPTVAEMSERAEKLANLARESGAPSAMVGGAPYFMSALEQALKARGIKPVYAFSVRKSVDKPNADGTVTKVAVFEHAGFVEV